MYGASVRGGRTANGLRMRRSPAHPLPGSGTRGWGSKGGAASPCQTAMFNIAWAGLGSVTVLSQHLTGPVGLRIVALANDSNPSEYGDSCKDPTSGHRI